MGHCLRNGGGEKGGSIFPTDDSVPLARGAMSQTSGHWSEAVVCYPDSTQDKVVLEAVPIAHRIKLS